jgi:hypothetical protein
LNGGPVSFDSLERARLSPDRIAACADLARHEVKIAVGRATVAVRFSRASAAAAFAERFADMLGDGEPFTVAYAVDLDDEALFWVSPERLFRWPRAISDHLLVFFSDILAMQEYLTTSSDVGFHSAVVASGPILVALVGRTTAGKTTTAIAAARSGFALYSDERCIIQDGRVVPFLRAITVREGGRAALLADAASATPIDARLREMPERGETPIRPSALLGSSAGGPPCRLAGMFMIEARDATPSVERCSLYDVLPELLKSMASADTGLARAARIGAELRGLPLYRLRLGSPSATVSAIERTLDEAYPRAKR